jgi:centrosomal protein CEP290
MAAEKELIEKEDEINELTRELKSKGKKRGGGSDTKAVKELEDELVEEREKHEAEQEELMTLRDTYAKLKTDYQNALDDISSAKALEQSHTKKIAEMQKEISEMSAANRMDKNKTQNVTKQKSEAMEESRRQRADNQRLQDQLDVVEAELARVSEEKEISVHLVSELIEEKEQLSIDNNNFNVVKDEMQARINALEFDLNKVNDQLSDALDHAEYHNKIEELETTLKRTTEQSAATYTSNSKEIAALREKLRELSVSSEAGRKQAEIDSMSKEHEEMATMLAEMQAELENALGDKKTIADKLMAMEQNEAQRFNEKLFAEREKIRVLEHTLDTLRQGGQDDQERSAALDKEVGVLSREVDELKHWKSVYEEDKGWDELLFTNNKLKNDNRMLLAEVERTSAKASATSDANGLLQVAFERLKVEAGKPSSFMYPEYELKEEQKVGVARLEAELLAVEDQVSALDGENMRLRKALRSAAGSFGASGFKFAGMKPEHLVKVNEFAQNLRDGKVELPQSDDSVEMMREVRRLKEDRAALQSKVDALERGGAVVRDGSNVAPVASSGAGDHADPGLADSLRDDLRKLHVENSELRTRMASMQSEVIGLIRNQAGHTIEHTESISAVMHAHNETLLNELKALKESGISMATMHAHTQQQQPAATPRTASRTPRATSQKEEPTPQMNPADVARAAAAAATGGGRPPLAESTPVGGVPNPAHGAAGLATPTVQFATPGAPYAATQYAMGQTMDVNMPFTQPNTPHGKVLLNKTLTQMNLPSEDWVDEVKELNGQLVECLEQLHERELELAEQHAVTSGLEDSLIGIKQQMAALYHDFSSKSDTWEKREKEYKDSSKALLNERDDLKLKLKRSAELTDHMKKADPDALENKLVEATRRMAILETNESVLSRRYTSLQELSDDERAQRSKLEADFVEMEASLKQRILYLEQYKSAASARLAFMQGKLSSSVPRGDYEAAHKELECLREEHLNVLRREVEARVAMVEGRESRSSLRALRIDHSMLKSELEASKAQSANLTAQLEHQRDATERVLASKGNSELSSVVSDMAVFRGEAGRLEVELAASRKKAEAAMEQCKLLTREAENAYERLDELSAREEAAVLKEDEARKEALKMMLKYDGGLPKEQAEELRKRVEKLTADMEDAQREATKYKEMAEVSSLQAQTIGGFRNARQEEVVELREHCARLEARSDDDILIGRLQRQLMATKSSYKQFVQKYQMLRGGMRQRELQIRLLEAKLDQRETTVASMQEQHHIETSALKKALRNVKNLTEGDPFLLSSKRKTGHHSVGGGDGKENTKENGRTIKPATNPGYVTVGMKMSKLSEKVRTLSELTDVSVSKARSAEEESAELEGKVQGLQTELQSVTQLCSDLERSIEKGGKSKAQAVASRLVTLSEEVRTNKLTVLQQRRQVQVLRQEKKHLQSLLQQTEMDVEDLEVGKVISDTKDLLGDIDGSALAGEVSKVDIGAANLSLDATVPTHNVQQQPTKGAPVLPGLHAPSKKLSIETSLDSGAPDSSELIEKLERATSDLAAARREASHAKTSSDKYISQLSEMEASLREQQEQIAYYEKMAQREGLPGMRPGGTGGGSRSPTRAGSDKQVRVMKEEQSKLQEAAGATIGSMKALLEEKNRLIENYRSRIEDLTASGAETGNRRKSKADKKAEALLERLEDEDRGGRHPGRYDGAGLAGAALTSEGHQKLLDQIDQADGMMQEKDREIRELETKLAQVHNMRERAETRCGSTLQEMEAMKADMITLAQQLQMSEDRLKRATGRPVTSKTPVNPDERRIQELTKNIKQKEGKIQGYREIIIRLKDEFIKAEEERAVSGGGARGGNGGDSSAAGLDESEFRDLKSQISSLRAGLTQAKQDLEEAKRTREKISKARGAAQQEVARLEGQVGRAESQAASAQESLLKTRKDLEETRRKEIRLRDKLKELLEADGGSDKLQDMKALTAKSEHFEKEVELLRAQNLALRRAAEEQSQQMAAAGTKASLAPAAATAEGGRPSQFPSNVGTGGGSATAFTGSANVLGAGAGDGPQDELRQQLHTKWESEKKLQKRLTVVEKRLSEKLSEVDDLTSQLQKAREMTQQAISSKEEYAKKAQAAGKKAARSAADGGGAGDSAAMEELNNKIFDLEESNARLRRTAEVEQLNAMSKMRHQISGLQMRVGELENELAESETRRKTAAAGGKRTLRDSEDKYLREERLKDEIDIVKKQKMELEAAILDRDARAIESRFDLEAKDQETDRLRKRVKELEGAYRHAAASAGGSPVRGPGGSTTLGGGGAAGGKGGSRREADLEGTIEAMKRVVDKLKAENDRFRKAASGGDPNKASEAEKKMHAQRQRADKLEDELTGLRAKLKGHEESSQKLVQRQQQLTAMRKQLRSREEEVETLKQASGGASEEVDTLRKKLRTYEDRISALEGSLTSAQSRGGSNNPAMDRELTELRQRATQQAADIEALRSALAEAEQKAAAAPGAGMTFPAPKPAGGGGIDGPVKDAELRRLREENEKLRLELSAFDMDFFEEIENLKYAHAEAVKKLRVYEGAGGAGGGRR